MSQVFNTSKEALAWANEHRGQKLKDKNGYEIYISDDGGMMFQGCHEGRAFLEKDAPFTVIPPLRDPAKLPESVVKAINETEEMLEMTDTLQHIARALWRAWHEEKGK